MLCMLILPPITWLTAVFFFINIAKQHNSSRIFPSQENQSTSQLSWWLPVIICILAVWIYSGRVLSAS